MFGIGPPELIVIFLIILILFGAKRLPELARSLGRSINEFKNATQNIKDDLDINNSNQSIPDDSEKSDKNKKTGSAQSEKKNSEDLAG
ncbi:MAG: twin-arginine translocase TatA/TatE family subunit [Calditrichaeota bacterium]|nr:twin-arginine translocase TatA/TatE family subunit [Calditrichota bacterium]RQW04674.1 MAG: twin-arginine translocase TatA/TatE family subunit [Calditrichota bacterium]